MSKRITGPKIMSGRILEAELFLVTASPGPYATVFSVASLNPPRSQFIQRSSLRWNRQRIDPFLSKGKRTDSRTTCGCLPNPFISSPLRSGWPLCRISRQMSLIDCGILSHGAQMWPKHPPYLMVSGRSTGLGTREESYKPILGSKPTEQPRNYK